jgi:hypothetical protein
MWRFLKNVWQSFKAAILETEVLLAHYNDRRHAPLDMALNHDRKRRLIEHTVPISNS